jgi:hypothetical protein
MNTTALRRTKSNVIEEMDFEEARKIDSVCLRRRQACLGHLSEKIKESLAGEIVAVYDQYLKNCAKAREEAESRELPVREKIDRAFQEFQLKHVQELVVIEEQHALEIIRAQSRTVPAQQDYIIQAKRMARIGNYDDSIATRERAQNAYEEELSARRGKIDAKFDALMKSALSRHKIDMAMLTEKLRTSLDGIKAAKEAALDSAIRRLFVTIKTLRRNAIVSVTRSQNIIENRGKTRLMEEVSNFIGDKFWAISGLNLEGRKRRIGQPQKLSCRSSLGLGRSLYADNGKDASGIV